MSQNPDISPELEAVEQAIDKEYLRNRLAGLTFSEASWYFPAFCEERLFKYLEFDCVGDRQDIACFTDEMVNSMKTPLRWLWRECEPGDRVPSSFSNDFYQASWDLSNLADQYRPFESAYIYARAGVVELRLQGNTVVPNPSFRGDTRFEAYDRLCVNRRPNIGNGMPEFFADVAGTVEVSGDRFRYKLSPAIVSRGLNALSPMLGQQFWLPASWQLPRYTFGDFQQVVSVLRVMAFIHFFARVVAARQGCVGMGYVNSVLVMDVTELFNRLRRYTRLDDNVVGAIVRDLTYGERAMCNPDPALQPLIPLTRGHIAVSPALFLGIDAERNFTVLLNRLPEERDAYSRLSTERESLSRQGITRQLSRLSIRLWNGKIPGRADLPDLDLAIIDVCARTCLVLELKAFVGPAEPREILEKSEEIKRGVDQLRRLRDAFRSQPATITVPLGIDVDYSVYFAVASETFIGTHDVQDDSIPVIWIPHLVRRLLADNSLATVCRWLNAREYLPIEGQQYEVKDILASVGDWKVQWYGIKPLISGELL